MTAQITALIVAAKALALINVRLDQLRRCHRAAAAAGVGEWIASAAVVALSIICCTTERPPWLALSIAAASSAIATATRLIAKAIGERSATVIDVLALEAWQVLGVAAAAAPPDLPPPVADQLEEARAAFASLVAAANRRRGLKEPVTPSR